MELKPYDIYHIGISGGKDSTAALLWATRESGWPHDKIRVTFCDTGNEHQFTYDYGARRVGCFPCFMSGKHEIRTIAKHFPERITMIRDAEIKVGGEERAATFFAADKVPEVYRSKPFVTKDGETIYLATIDDVVAWSKSGYRSRGGQYEMDFDDPPQVCNSNLGACE